MGRACHFRVSIGFSIGVGQHEQRRTRGVADCARLLLPFLPASAVVSVVARLGLAGDDWILVPGDGLVPLDQTVVQIEAIECRVRLVLQVASFQNQQCNGVRLLSGLRVLERRDVA